MKRKKALFAALLALGALLVAGGLIFLQEEALKTAQGVCLGIGACLIGISFSKLYMLRYQERHPEEEKWVEIETSDERNIMIRNRAKARAGDILQWCVMGLAWVGILFDLPLWLILVAIGIFVLKTAVEMVLMSRYARVS